MSSSVWRGNTSQIAWMNQLPRALFRQLTKPGVVA